MQPQEKLHQAYLQPTNSLLLTWLWACCPKWNPGNPLLCCHTWAGIEPEAESTNSDKNPHSWMWTTQLWDTKTNPWESWDRNNRGEKVNVVSLEWLHGDLNQNHPTLLVMLWNKCMKGIIQVVELNSSTRNCWQSCDCLRSLQHLGLTEESEKKHQNQVLGWGFYEICHFYPMYLDITRDWRG